MADNVSLEEKTVTPVSDNLPTNDDDPCPNEDSLHCERTAVSDNVKPKVFTVV